MSVEDKFWSKEQLKAIHKPRGKFVTHMRITPPGGRKAAVVRWEDKDTLTGVCGKIELLRAIPRAKKTTYEVVKVIGFPPKADKAEPAKAEPKTEKKAPKAETKTPKAKAEKKAKRSKCAFIDGLLEKGGLTLAKILDETLKTFPDADAGKTLRTVRCRPYHMRKAGKKPSWVKESGVLA